MKSKVFLIITAFALFGTMLISCSPAKRNTLTGTTFKNDKCGSSITVADNWSMKECKQSDLGPHVFLVQFFSDDFDSNIIFLAQDNSMNFTAEEAVNMDISNMKANKSVDFELMDKSPYDLKGYEAYQMIDKFSARGITVFQKRIYIVTDSYLYGIILNSKTQEPFDRDLGAFDDALKTLVITK